MTQACWGQRCELGSMLLIDGVMRKHGRDGVSVLALCFVLALAACGGEDRESDKPQQESALAAEGASATDDVEATQDANTEEAQPEVSRSITIAATGDVLPHSSVLDSAARNAAAGSYDFGPMFAQIQPLVSSADLALCHLETPLSADNTNLTQPRVFSFASPHELAKNLADAGYDGCDFASNHTMDRGLEGLGETEDVLAEAGLGYAGPTARKGRAGKAYVYDVQGVAVAHLAYTYTLPNDGSPNTVVPADAPWLGRSLWPLVGADGILTDAAQARAGGAEVVIVSMQWGQEYHTEPTADQIGIAQTLLDSGDVDLILGTHVHVPQPCAKINDRYVLYGMGNGVSNQSPETDSRLRPETQEGMVAEVTLTLDPEGTVTSTLAVLPTRVNLDGHVIEPAGEQNHPESAERTMRTLESLGTCQPTQLGR